MQPENTSCITDKTMVIEVRDSGFAAALFSIGIPFVNPAKPYTAFEHADGTRTTMWRFASMSSDGKMSVQPLLKAQADPLAWVAANPQHPFGYALCAMLNARKFEEAAKTGRALVGFRLSHERVIYVYKDSRKHRKLAAMGAKQI